MRPDTPISSGSLPAGSLPGVRWSIGGGRVIKLRMGACSSEQLDGKHGLERTDWTALTTVSGRCKPKYPRRAAGEYGFYNLVDQGPTVRAIRTFAEGLGQAHDHVLVLGIGGLGVGNQGPPHCTASPGLERAGR